MSKLSRRNFLEKSSALALSTLASPLIVNSSTLGLNGVLSPNSKLNIALIGSGGIAISAFHDCAPHNVVAIAEVDDLRGAPGYERFPLAKRYRDFRVMLDKHEKELDLVIISTPDHTHFAATYAAMERGIHVHTQKPLTHNIWQANQLKSAAHKYNVKTVMGNQGHNFEGMRLIREWYEAGMVGKVREVHAWTNRSSTNSLNAKKPIPSKQTIPSTFDWDLWLGPVAERPYNKTYAPKGWRWWWEFGSGGLGDIGCHTLEIPFYSMQLGYPDKVYIDDTVPYYNVEDVVEGRRANKAAATYVYEFPADGNREAVKVFWYEGGRLPKIEGITDPEKLAKSVEGGCYMIGDKNTLYSPGMRPTSPRLVNNWLELRRELPPKTVPRAIGGPIKEVIGAIQGKIDQCGSNFDYASSLTEIVLLGVIANRSQKLVEYLPKQMSFKDTSLNEYIKEPVRKGWEYGE